VLFALWACVPSSAFYDPMLHLRAHQLGPLELSVKRVVRLAAGPFFYRHRDLWEWESSQLGQLSQGAALFGNEYSFTRGALTLRFEPSLIPATSAEEFYSGLNFVWGNRLGLEWDLGQGRRFTVRERAYVYSNKVSGSGTVDGFYANPLFENRVTATLEWPMAHGALVARLPVHLQQRLYMNCEGAEYDGMLRNWLWLAPEIALLVSPSEELSLSYTTETLVSSHSGRWYVLDGLMEGVAEITYRVKL
jgi:hypothetical protein